LREAEGDFIGGVFPQDLSRYQSKTENTINNEVTALFYLFWFSFPRFKFKHNQKVIMIEKTSYCFSNLSDKFILDH